MKAIIYTFFFLFLFTSAFSQRKKCGADAIYERALLDPAFALQQKQLTQQVKEMRFSKSDTIVYIATVVHVIYKNEKENISEDQIISQLQVLNEDYNKQNADTTNVDPEFSIADIKINFSLAARAPDGSPTTGITRTETTIDDIGNTSEYYKLVPAWNSKYYLNIWVCDIGDDLLGFAYPPNAPGVQPEEDGVVIGTDYFGTTSNVIYPYNKGRTTTHEVGHFFNLYHPWGPGTASCNSDDQVEDTPNQGEEVYDCPTSHISCSSKDMLSNFMGYIDDRCMGNFTLGQKERMRTTLAFLRDSLQYNDSVRLILPKFNLIPNLYPNPASKYARLDLEEDFDPLNTEVQITNISGKIIKAEFIITPRGISVDVTGLKNGFYLLVLREKNDVSTKKLFVRH